MAKRSCPFCGKQTTAAAIRCRRCGAQLQELLLASDPTIKPVRKPFSLAAASKMFLYGLIVISCAICGVAALLPRRPSPYLHASPARGGSAGEYHTTAADLYQNYVAYEEVAKLPTGNSAIQISGTVRSVDHGLFGEAEVLLDAGGESKSVAVTLDRNSGGDSTALVTGAKVNVRCENMTQILGPPTGQDCRLL